VLTAAEATPAAVFYSPQIASSKRGAPRGSRQWFDILFGQVPGVSCIEQQQLVWVIPI